MYANMCFYLYIAGLRVVKPLSSLPAVMIGIGQESPSFPNSLRPYPHIAKRFRSSDIGNFPIYRNVGVRCDAREGGGNNYW
jgi:hypothetical protein